MMKLRVAILVAVLLCVLAQAANAAPSVYLKLKAQGTDIPGDAGPGSPGGAGSIGCLSFGLGVTVPMTAGGMATGMRQYERLVITKRLDRSSVLLLKALIQHEVCECEFRFFRLDPVTRAEEHIYTVSLSDARISAVRQHVSQEDSTGGGLAPIIEEVEFAYQGITWSWADGGIEFMDSLSGEASAASATTTEPPAVVKPSTPVRRRVVSPKPEG